MEQMVRKQIYIRKRQDAMLKRQAKLYGVSEAEVIRRALDDSIGLAPLRSLQPDPVAWEHALKFMRALRARGPIPNQRRTWKREDAYEERMNRYDRNSR